MGKIKWYYFAIPVALVLAYLMFSSKAKTAKAGTSSSSLGSTLTGAGAAATGVSKLWGTIFGDSSSDSTTSDNAET